MLILPASTIVEPGLGQIWAGFGSLTSASTRLRRANPPDRQSAPVAVVSPVQARFATTVVGPSRRSEPAEGQSCPLCRQNRKHDGPLTPNGVPNVSDGPKRSPIIATSLLRPTATAALRPLDRLRSFSSPAVVGYLNLCRRHGMPRLLRKLYRDQPQIPRCKMRRCDSIFRKATTP